MTKFQMHTATDETALQHGTSPSRARDGHPDWFRTVPGMAGDQSVVVTQKHNLVTVVLGLDLQDSREWQVVEEYAPFNFRLRDVAIHLSAEVGMGAQQMWIGGHANASPGCRSVYVLEPNSSIRSCAAGPSGAMSLSLSLRCGYNPPH
jgi:hypothetical protein